MSKAHAVLEKQCAACHREKAGAFSAKASDSACLSCHDGPAHHTAQPKTLGCAECHSEHHGRVNLVAARNESCASCHGDLRSIQPNTKFAADIYSFEEGHPEFAAVRANGNTPARDPGTIKLNHAIHMKPIRRGPNGPNVQLECRDCHRPEADEANSIAAWKYEDAHYVSATTAYSMSDELRPATAGMLPTYRPATGRERMAPVKFASACAGCHSLAFDKRFSEGVPHDKPEVVHEFLLKKFGEYIAAHPAELRAVGENMSEIPGKRTAVPARALTSGQWVAQRTSEAEDLLWRKTCKQCHALTAGDAEGSLPTVEPARTTERWMPHAKFDHDAHRSFTCKSCHAKALTSTEASDVLLPGIATCKACHAPGPQHAESRCFECHTYHDWSKRKEMRPTFSLPGLRTGGE